MAQRRDGISQGCLAYIHSRDVRPIHLSFHYIRASQSEPTEPNYLVKGEHAEVHIPFLHVDLTMGSIGYTIDAEFHLARSNFLGFSSCSFNNLFNGNNRAKDV